MIYVPVEHEPEVTQEVCSLLPHSVLSWRTYSDFHPRDSLSVPFILNALNASDLIAFSALSFPSAWLSLLSRLSQPHPAR